MTKEEAKKMLKAKLECLKREISGTDFDCNNSNCDECPLCYEKGNMGEQKEALDIAIKALEQEPRWIPVSERLPKPYTYVNATCRSLVDDRANWVVETLYLPIPKENNERGYSDWGDIPMLNWHKAEVVAWMERKIPEPYKPERSKND